uniref:Hemocyanin N-terminal domain-containing protein n=1 Tax=Megaselia scalaris TaxID=36166 RepID=T1GDN3_MEGSC
MCLKHIFIKNNLTRQKTMLKVICLAATVIASANCAVNLGDNFVKADDNFLKQQRIILEVLRFVKFDDKDSEYFKDSEKWNVTSGLVWDELQFYNSEKFVKKSDSFNIFDVYHRKAARVFFDVFYRNKEWDELYKVFVWARYNLNPELFVYSFTVALLHRKDMPGMELPSISEIFPNFFFDDEFLKNIQDNLPNYNKDDNDFIFKHEHKCDIRPCMEYVLLLLKHGLPVLAGWRTIWLGEDRRGELYFFEHKQLLNRYYLERLANNLGPVDNLDLFGKIEGYQPSLKHLNGDNFSSRDNDYFISNKNNFYDLKAIIRAENIGVQSMTHEHYGLFLQNNPDNPFGVKFTLEDEMRKVIDPEMKGALGHIETSLRDPLFYMMQKRMVENHLKFPFGNYVSDMYYTATEVGFPGVEIKDASIDKLVTHFDKSDSDITSFFPPQKGKIIKARQMRLNHEPFEVTIKVRSTVARKAVVRLFMGPKSDDIKDEDMRKFYYLLETFAFDLKEGENTIKRHSRDFTWHVRDRTPYYALYQWVLNAINDIEYFPLDMTESHCGFPQRLMLPKGDTNMELQFFIILSDSNHHKRSNIQISIVF